MLLFFIATLLLDARLYLTAAVTGILAATTLLAFVVQHFRQRRYEREREQRKVAEAARRAEAAEARAVRRARRRLRLLAKGSIEQKCL